MTTARTPIPHCRPAAFTLIELLVVIGVLVAMAALLIPAVTSVTKSNSLSTGGRLVANLLVTARSEAISQRRLTQVRIATKWLNSAGTEETALSYRKFSVWRRPLPTDNRQSSDPNDPYIQVSPWETLPTGILFESDPAGYSNLPQNGTPNDPGTFAMGGTLTNIIRGIKVPKGTADAAWIAFDPTGASSVSGAPPGRVFFLLTEGNWNGTTVSSTHLGHPNWLLAQVDTLVGRVKVVRP